MNHGYSENVESDRAAWKTWFKKAFALSGESLRMYSTASRR